MISYEKITKFITKLKEDSDYDLSNYSVKSLGRRIEWVLESKNMTYTMLIDKLNDKQFKELILKEITVNTTELFRDPEVWQSIRYRIIKKLNNNEKINIWHAGCSTGEEVYSMLILLYECGIIDRTNVYASDINMDVIEKAKKGIYKFRFNAKYLNNFDKVLKMNPYNYEEIKDVPYGKYFDIDRNRDIIIMKDFLRDKVIYRYNNLTNFENVFYKKFDLILCRNVLIYFNDILQKNLFSFFHENLYNSSYLVLGKQESTINATDGSYMRKGLFYKKIENDNI